MALPTALFAMVACLALASAAVMSSVNAQQGTQRDRESKNAIAAADAGASVALLRLNRYQHSLTEATPCVGPGGEHQEPSGGWCPPTTAEGVGGSIFFYAVSAFEKGKELSVVSVGASGGVSRRVEVGLTSYNWKTLSAHEHLIGQEDITLEGGHGLNVKTDIGTNGNVEETNGNVTICGDIRHGVGKESPSGQPEPRCGTVTEENQNLPPVTPPADIATNNSDCRLVPNCPAPREKEIDTYTKNRNAKTPWNTEYTPGAINVGQDAALTMGGANYFVCKLEINNGQLIMAAAPGVEVQIFVDTPEHCGLAPGATQVEITGNANIVSTGFNQAEGKYAVPAIYLLGSGSVKLNGNSGTNELLLYAPESEVEVGGNATWIGMIAGKSLKLHGGPTLESNAGIAPSEDTTQSLWERTHYVECTGSAGASSPNASC